MTTCPTCLGGGWSWFRKAPCAACKGTKVDQLIPTLAELLQRALDEGSHPLECATSCRCWRSQAKALLVVYKDRFPREEAP